MSTKLAISPIYFTISPPFFEKQSNKRDRIQFEKDMVKDEASILGIWL